MRGLEVFVDDVFRGDLSYGNELTHDVAPGEHTVKVTNSLYTRKLTFTLAPGETVRLEAGNVLRGCGGVMMLAIGMGPYKVFLREAIREPGLP